LKRVGERSLGWLYRHCLFTVFPSLYEGWGLPVAESLAFGKFCISSDRGALPEVGGDLVEYLDPWDTVAWTEALRKYTSEPERLRERESRIRSRFRLKTWEQFGEAFFQELQAFDVSRDRGESHGPPAEVFVPTGSGQS
jgi:glycosyltransferase involved in cell wall biosynthesis